MGVLPCGAAPPAAAQGVGRARQGLRLICRGRVQGVGFRPAVARLAASLGLEGRLVNIAGAVQIELAGPRAALERLLRQLPDALPGTARLEALQSTWLTPPLPPHLAEGSGLHLGTEAPRPLRIGLVAPSLMADRAPCDACRRELSDPGNRRFRYPFISCCSCGPRYSIATAEPFSRAHTTLAGFRLCPACQAEFDDPADRRFHAETIGCPACGPRLRLLAADGGRVAAAPAADPLGQAVALLRSGRILALQGVGGFQLLVDARDADAVARLRARKRRPDKPFALLVDDPARLAELVHPSAEEWEALNDPAAPIVLLRCSNASHHTVLAGVAPGAPGLGVMRPASPLHLLLAEAFAGPLVATSGNRSGEPLCIDPSEAVERLSGIADAFLVHDRPIARPLDDSVLQLIDGRPALLRRARGYAPEALALGHGPATPEAKGPSLGRTAAMDSPAAAAVPGQADATLLALGSDLKSAPGLAIGDQLWLAPHLGDLADPRCQERWRAGIAELLQRQQGERLAVGLDGHPQYLSCQLAGSLLPPDSAARRSLHPVAHHRAHGLAVAAEHGLPLPLAALVLDGLGFGGGPVPLWGCELLWLEPGGASRLATLRPFPLPGGERAVREPRRSALGLLWAADRLTHPGAGAVRAAFDGEDLRLLSQAIAAGCNSPWCSSAGRLFDAVASLLDQVQQASHDAQPGLLLQSAADCAPPRSGAYPLPLRDSCSSRRGAARPDANDEDSPPELDWQPLLEALLEDIAARQPVELCAARFHTGLIEGLAEAVVQLADPETAASAELPDRDRGLQRHDTPGRGLARQEAASPSLILAGGCFQNRRLLEGLIAALRRRGFRPHWAEQLPGNDGGLAAGQILALRQATASAARQT